MQLALLSWSVCLSGGLYVYPSVCRTLCPSVSIGTFKHFSRTQYAEMNPNCADTLQLQATSFAYYIWLLIKRISDSHPNTPCSPIYSHMANLSLFVT